ncbi:MAG: PSD1 and planctomycete cytochrome C domain-containing protein [Lentisphaeraceae bacterium]|nr:PSD1 and planctomycete cytochrome C domain-containing protein [Lentisphaeraceae bacterium]
MKLLMSIIFVFSLVLPTVNANEQEKFFSLKVYPLLKNKCFGCHGDKPEKLKGDLDVSSLEGILKGGESGLAGLIKGDAKNSLIYKSILWLDEDLEMPPKENDRLTKAEVSIVEKWINTGAVWVDESSRTKYLEKEQHLLETKDGLIVKTSGGLDESWTYRRYKKEDLWAYQPLEKIETPKGLSPIDFFIRKKLSEKNITPAKKADKRTLLRRATYNMTGLPPTPKELDEFLNDNSQTAWEKVVDRLLASQHYGEHWGQNWLDVARYSDTSGFASDWEKSNAWRYRDYVIRSLNKDKPINQFFREQIAGDEIDPQNPEMIVATGFLRMGPYGTAMIAKEEARQQFLDDVTNSVGETFMAHALKCASCHDHKFDPIPTKDYYSIQAVFAATHPGEMSAKYLAEESQDGFEEGRNVIEMRLAEARKDVKKILKKQEAAARKWMAERGLEYKPRKDLQNEPEGKKPPRAVGLSVQEQGFLKVREQDVRMYTRRLERYMPLAQSVYNGNFHLVNEKKLRPPQNINTAKMQTPPKTYILSGGALTSKGSEVKPGIFSAVPTSANITNQLNGRRKDFANWLTSDENSLVIRTFVNRVWQGHFGLGIAANPNNFGKTGAKPSHPELLDQLSIYFRDNAWSAKKLHKLILMSEAYQMSSKHENIDEVKKLDPDNKLLAYFNLRRLTSEELRDTILATTGELNKQMGGLPIFPEINLDVALQQRMLQFSLAPAYQPSRTPEQRHRRSLYAYQTRGMPVPFMSVFNKPNADDSCERRDSSSVTPQVFTLFNSDNSYDRSVAFARRLKKERTSVKDQVSLAFKLAFGRSADQEKLSAAISHVHDRIPYHQKNKPEVETYPKLVERNCVEEFTGETFQYFERLDIYENYISDKKMWDVDPTTRALADLCLVLFNSNEFIYIY